MTFLENLDWRHATKSFDPNKKVSEADLAKIKDAIQMAPTSFGLQPFHVVIVTEPAIRDQIKPVSWDQAQITDSSHLLVFCSRTDTMERLDGYFEIASGGKPEVRAKMEMYENMMKGALEPRSAEDHKHWADKQTYIAHGFALAACAELKIDSCPIEGFDPAAVDKILGLPENTQSVVLMPIGYRAEEPKHGKVRFPESDLFS
jgi:nitroreductase